MLLPSALPIHLEPFSPAGALAEALAKSPIHLPPYRPPSSCPMPGIQSAGHPEPLKPCKIGHTWTPSGMTQGQNRRPLRYASQSSVHAVSRSSPKNDAGPHVLTRRVRAGGHTSPASGYYGSGRGCHAFVVAIGGVRLGRIHIYIYISSCERRWRTHVF